MPDDGIDLYGGEQGDVSPAGDDAWSGRRGASSRIRPGTAATGRFATLEAARDALLRERRTFRGSGVQDATGGATGERPAGKRS